MVDVSDGFGDGARLAEICQRYGIARLLVFGSVARRTAQTGSDIDILYELLPERHLGWEIDDLADELSGLFERPVDLVSTSGLHRSLRPAVLTDARSLYAA